MNKEQIDDKTLEVCRKILARERQKNAGNFCSEYVLFCRKNESGIYDIIRGVAKISRDRENSDKEYFSLAEFNKIVFIMID